LVIEFCGKPGKVADMAHRTLSSLWTEYGHFLSPVLAVGLVSASFYFGLAMGFGGTFLIFLDLSFFAGEILRFGLALALPALFVRIGQMVWLSLDGGGSDAHARHATRYTRALTLAMIVAQTVAVTSVVFDHMLIDFRHQVFLVILVANILIAAVMCVFIFQLFRGPVRHSPARTVAAVWTCLRHPVQTAATTPVFLASGIVLLLYLSFTLGAMRVSALASSPAVTITLAQGAALEAVMLGTNANGLILFERAQEATTPVLSQFYGALAQALPLQQSGGMVFVPYDAVIRVDDGLTDDFPRDLGDVLR